MRRRITKRAAVGRCSPRRDSLPRGFLVLLMAVSGCSQAPEETAAVELTLQPGMRITLTPTVLGLGAGLKSWTGDQSGLKKITILKAPPQGLSLDWVEEVREETEVSRRRRDAFEKRTSKLGVGVDRPDPPQAEYEVRVRRGRILAPDFAESGDMTLPTLWPEAEERLPDTSLLWLSPPAFSELRATRRTRWSPGLVGSPLLQPGAVFAEFRRGVQALQEEMGSSTAKEQTFHTIEANAEFGTFDLLVNGRPSQVRTIVARNWVAEYVILDDPQNPLILKFTLNPLSGGAIDVFSPLGVLKSILGYQVLEINTAENSS